MERTDAGGGNHAQQRRGELQQGRQSYSSEHDMQNAGDSKGNNVRQQQQQQQGLSERFQKENTSSLSSRGYAEMQTREAEVVHTPKRSTTSSQRVVLRGSIDHEGDSSREGDVFKKRNMGSPHVINGIGTNNVQKALQNSSNNGPKVVLQGGRKEYDGAQNNESNYSSSSSSLHNSRDPDPHRRGARMEESAPTAQNSSVCAIVNTCICGSSLPELLAM
jgi:hypothetical protein